MGSMRLPIGYLFRLHMSGQPTQEAALCSELSSLSVECITSLVTRAFKCDEFIVGCAAGLFPRIEELCNRHKVRPR